MKFSRFAILMIILLGFQPALPQQPSSSIRSVDFENFTFPGDPIFGKKKFKLLNGHFQGDRGREPIGLMHIGYGDVTNDGVEEAIVSLVVTVKGGTAKPHLNYVYTLADGKPKLLWSFDTGDRADGGLRRIYAENGNLIVERYNSEGSRGDCCPVFFERTRYRWNGKRFQQFGVIEKLPHPEGYGFPVMKPHYSRGGTI
jgi:hypothetical protein